VIPEINLILYIIIICTSDGNRSTDTTKKVRVSPKGETEEAGLYAIATTIAREERTEQTSMKTKSLWPEGLPFATTSREDLRSRALNLRICEHIPSFMHKLNRLVFVRNLGVFG